MKRHPGGYIGFRRVPAASSANSAASGVWTLRDAESLKRAGTWPSEPTVPGTPTSLSATAGNAQVSLAWTAPADNGGTAITDYAVQFSSDSGATWSTFADGTSSATSATVTGLTNGTAYVFRVAAINAAGTGAYTAASSSVTPASISLMVTGTDSANYSGNGTAATPFARTVASWPYEAGAWLVMPEESTVRFTVSGGAATFRMTYRSGDTAGDGDGEIFLRRRSSGGSLLSQINHGGWGGGSDGADRSFTQSFNAGDYLVFGTNGYGGRIWIKAVWVE